MTTIELTSCLVCGSTRAAPDPLGGVLRRCADCAFAVTRAAIPDPEDLYDEAYFHGAGYEDYVQPDARRHEAGIRLAWLRSSGATGRVLEAGSAAGFFVEACRRSGLDAEGVEVSAALATYAREVLHAPVRQGCFEDADLTGPYDAVCAFHVLEHVADPRAFLDAARRVVRPGGHLLLEVPNIASPAARRLGTAWPGLQPAYHRWHFSPASLRRLVEEHGFEVVHLDTAVFRSYMPVRYRRRAGRRLIAADLRDMRSLRLSHPHRGDLLRLTARRVPDGVR